MESITQAEAERLHCDLMTAHQTLRDIYAILANINSTTENLFFEIGRAQGTASNGLIMSGGKR